MVGNQIRGKREMLARGLAWSGTSWLMSHLPATDSLLVLAYHRIGNPDEDLFDPGVFSATADEFNDHISFLKRRMCVVTLDEALAFVHQTAKEKSSRARVLITFDDGYLDNYQTVFPILRSHGVQGVFFLATHMVGSAHVPWWDHIAFLIKTARRRQFKLSFPAGLKVDLDRDGADQSLHSVLRLFKRPENTDHARFLSDLADETKGDAPSSAARRFLNWEEAREMIASGMAIGSHTHSHQLLNQLNADRQTEELSKSRSILEQQLGTTVDVIAYPVGARDSFTTETKTIARDLGYRAAFSHHGGKNLPGQISPFDIKRHSIGGQSWNRFKVQASVCKRTGNYWP
jgi:peptidoglycan/xylan/chitin deacetylase (PgdA/CDA1 family)